MARPRKAAKAAPAPTLAEFNAALERLEQVALAAGASAELLRIAAILNSEAARGCLPLAWSLAQAGLDPEAACEALAVAKLASTLPPIDAGASLTH
jgi:hypothetical protein